jgi:hypothetical protein
VRALVKIRRRKYDQIERVAELPYEGEVVELQRVGQCRIESTEYVSQRRFCSGAVVLIRIA